MNRHRMIVAAALAVMVAATSAVLVTAGGRANAAEACTAPEVVGHRGVPRHHVENTLRSVRGALRAGAVVETDVRATANARPMLMHDRKVDRTTDGRGRVRRLPAWRVRRFRTVERTRVPFLSETLSAVRERGGQLQMEIKRPAVNAVGMVRLVRRKGMLDHTVIASGIARVLARVRDTAPGSRRLQGLYEPLPDSASLIANAAELGLEAYGAPLRLVDAEMVAKLHAAGVELVVRIVNGATEYEHAAALGVDRVLTDRPWGARRWRADYCATGGAS